MPDITEDLELSRNHLATRCNLHAAIGFPITNGRDFLGAMEFFSQRIDRPEPESLAMMAAIGSQIGQFIEKRHMAAALAKEQEFLKAVLENAQDGIVACDANGTVTFFNRVARKFHGKEERSLPSEDWLPDSELYHADGKTTLAKAEIPLHRALHGEVVQDVEIVICSKGGIAHSLLATARSITDAGGQKLGAVVVMHDVTERNLLELQLRQSQKMEAFGQLAGGIAHDFNNLLTIILGYSELVLGSLPTGDRNRELIGQIQRAGERAALLTRQLLAFSRKQVVQPQVLSINEIVASAEKMLGRLIGEDIDLVVVAATGLHLVKADPGQIEQIIMNLVVNARDAMPLGGRITIETSNVDLDASHGETHVDVKPGPYVLLTVSDTGCGMTKEVIQHAFEPFFTTKEIGKGTGLGLATVFGIVRQSAGHVRLYSEVGQGTTFKAYLPAVEVIAESIGPLSASAPEPVGKETILLVEDEGVFGQVTRIALGTNGYSVLEATDVKDAIRICSEFSGAINLLISDVVMPGMGGRELAKQLTELRPENAGIICVRLYR